MLYIVCAPTTSTDVTYTYTSVVCPVRTEATVRIVVTDSSACVVKATMVNPAKLECHLARTTLVKMEPLVSVSRATHFALVKQTNFKYLDLC